MPMYLLHIHDVRMSTRVRTAVLDCDYKYCVRDKVCPAVGKCGIGVSSIVVGT